MNLLLTNILQFSCDHMKNIVHVTMEDFGTGNVSHHESSVEWKITPDLKDFHVMKPDIIHTKHRSSGLNLLKNDFGLLRLSLKVRWTDPFSPTVWRIPERAMYCLIMSMGICTMWAMVWYWRIKEMKIFLLTDCNTIELEADIKLVRRRVFLSFNFNQIDFFFF